ncbi:MAG: response regulator transcription factor [Candidatus Paceibacterota bacterium]
MAKILIIEDEKALQETLGKILEKKGFAVVPAFDGEVGLELTVNEKPDLVLLDLMMPKMNGFDYLVAMKKNSSIASTPVIVLTNSDSTEHIQKVIDAGATTYLVKSNYSLEEVVQKVEAVLAKK